MFAAPALKLCPSPANGAEPMVHLAANQQFFSCAERSIWLRLVNFRQSQFLMIRYRIIACVFFALTTALHADELPVKVTFRQSLLIRGTFVAQFRNEGDKNLILHAEFDRADASARKTFTLLVPANHFKEVGHNQGWNVQSGDQLTITSEGYDDVHCHIP